MGKRANSGLVQRRVAATAEDLKRQMLEEFDTLAEAWHEVLDKEHRGSIGYKEFLTGCRRLGFVGDMRGHFAELDKDATGLISLVDLDATGEMHIMERRCTICTLPNPCTRHSEAEQKMALIALKRLEPTKEQDHIASWGDQLNIKAISHSIKNIAVWGQNRNRSSVGSFTRSNPRQER